MPNMGHLPSGKRRVCELGSHHFECINQLFLSSCSIISYVSLPEGKPWDPLGIYWDQNTRNGYPLVNVQKAMENGYENSGFSH